MAVRTIKTEGDQSTSFASIATRKRAPEAVLSEQLEYAVDVVEGGVERRALRGASHAEAMTRAEGLQRDGKVARVIHLVGDASYEVDRYPPR